MIVIAQVPARRKGLQIALCALDRSIEVEAFADVESTLRTPRDPVPELVLLDGSQPISQMAAEVGRIRQQWPHCFLLVLVEEEEQEQQLLQAGATQTLAKGMAATRLFATLQELLRQMRPAGQKG